ncbi:MAG: Rrf2 family transcriptional regulator [Hespellia sp.]|nr:Rrf2 family transcriptional regulator [Hespellia sp.]
MTGEMAIAVHALVYLDMHADMISSEVLAENVCTNPVRIRKVMSKLKKAGLVDSREGIDGGYYLRDDVKKIRLSQVMEAVQVEAVTMRWHTGNKEKDCMISSGMAEVMDGLCGELNEECRKYLSGVTISDIEQRLRL